MFRKEYEKLRRLRCKLVERYAKQLKDIGEIGYTEWATNLDGSESWSSETFTSARPFLSTERDGMVDNAAGYHKMRKPLNPTHVTLKKMKARVVSGVTHFNTSSGKIELWTLILLLMMKQKPFRFLLLQELMKRMIKNARYLINRWHWYLQTEEVIWANDEWIKYKIGWREFIPFSIGRFFFKKTFILFPLNIFEKNIPVDSVP